MNRFESVFEVCFEDLRNVLGCSIGPKHNDEEYAWLFNRTNAQRRRALFAENI
jgi:hypothetical protein